MASVSEVKQVKPIAARPIVKKNVTFKIFRHSSNEDEELRYDNYTFEVDSNTHVIDVLDRIKEEIDPTLTYRSSCHSGVCGSCICRVNGVEVQTCKAMVFDVLQGQDVVIEPMRNFRVLKDLVVDTEPFFEKIRSVRPRLFRTTEASLEREDIQSPENVGRMHDFEACIECGACYSACPIASSDPDYLGPAALVAAYRSCLDSRDKGRHLRLSLVDNENGCWRCHNNFECIDACPKNVRPTLAIMGLRRMIISTRLRSIFGLKRK